MISWKRLATNLNRFIVLGIALSAIVATGQPAGVKEPSARSDREHLDPLPLAFVPNAGQSEAAVVFQAVGRSGALAFSPNEVMLTPTANATLGVQFLDANPAAHIVGHDPLPGVVNFYAGHDPARWHSDLPTYSAIIYNKLYDGIDLTYNGSEGSLKGTYTIAPGHDPNQIRWRYAGADDVSIDPVTGDLHITLGGTQLIERAPIAWQDRAGAAAPIEVRYLVQPDGSINFAFAPRDPTLPLIVDPTLVYGTYLGANNTDSARGIAVDGNGN